MKNERFEEDKDALSPMIEIIILAAVAIFLFSRLFSVIGKEKGAPPPAYGRSQEEEPQRRPVHVVPEPGDDFDDENASGLEKIARADPGFTQREFVKGAKAAYEMIVQAFADGDRKTLKNLLTPDVYDDYDAAIKAREESGAEPLELMRIRESEIESGELNGSVAEVSVVFAAELTDGERVSKTRELWTFERDIKSRDPNWRLSDVSAA